MLLITCPWCGDRDESEFRYGGESGGPRPTQGHETDERAWGEYLFMRKNTCGVIEESWFHQHGCRRWIALRRDTRTSAIVGAAEQVPETPVGAYRENREEEP